MSDYTLSASATAEGYTIRSGREVFEEITRTGMNKRPVTAHLPRILGKTEQPPTPWGLEDVATRLLVDGSLLAREGLLQDGLICASPTHAEQLLPGGYSADGSGARLEQVTRVYDRNVGPLGQPDGPWRVSDWTGWGSDKAVEVAGPFTLPADDVWVYSNGRGLLFDVQIILDRIERICNTIEEQMSGAALSLIITGFVGDWENTKAQLSSGPRIANFSGRNVQVHRVGSTAVIDHLLAELDMLRPNFLELTNLVDTSKGANTSGEAWRIRLEAMYYFIQRTQQRLAEIWLGRFGVALHFANYQVTSAQSRLTELQLLTQLLTSTPPAITPEEYQRAAHELMPS